MVGNICIFRKFLRYWLAFRNVDFRGIYSQNPISEIGLGDFGKNLKPYLGIISLDSGKTAVLPAVAVRTNRYVLM